MLDIESIMTTDLVTVSPDDTLHTARALMRDKHIRHLPVVDASQHLVGLITQTNILTATDSFLRDDESRIHLRDIRIGDVMVTDVATVDEHAGLRHAALYMEKHRYGCLPVISNGKLRGILTDTDFVAVAINLMEQAESAEPMELEFED